MKLWLFATYAWQGNPKALFLYMTKYYEDTHTCWWIADTEKDALALKEKYDIENITFLKSREAKDLFSKADVYVNENFRENYPLELSKHTKIFNTWHGVGLKHIEIGVDKNLLVANSVFRKHVRGFERFFNQVIFLTTSEKMQEHFLRDTIVPEAHMLQGVYPRNIVYAEKDISTYQFNDVLGKLTNSHKSTVLFAPTHRTNSINGVFQYLLPSLSLLEVVLQSNNQLFIIKVHPSMTKDEYFLRMKKEYEDSQNILFWDDSFDIYEIFSEIDIAIIDYSSIFYDLLDAGVEKFIRYIPDYAEYNKEMNMIEDYHQYTDGTITESFNDLIEALSKNQMEKISKKDFLIDYFFGYQKDCHIEDMIDQVDNFILDKKVLKELHTFDVFDTLIKRSTLKPLSVFAYVQDKAAKSQLNYPQYLLENWIVIRNKVEHDVRDIARKTIFERQSDTLEIGLDAIFNRLLENFALTKEQVDFLRETEIEAEIAHVEPITEKIDLLFSLKEQGHDVLLISDMYLPESVIHEMLSKIDVRLNEVPLYLSTNVGHQKASGKLYKHIFFDIDYQYAKWVHYGDNKYSDGVVPRKYGIETIVHDIEDFIPFESKFIDSTNTSIKYVAYELATKMQRYRTSLISCMNNVELEQKYYAYAYAGSALVPYVHWVVKDAIRRGYKTLYFVSRDGHFLKQAADEIISIQQYPIKTKYIYGSRKAWRVPSFIDEVDDETFGHFGNFVGMDNFDDLVKASWLTEDELLSLFPELIALKDEKHLRGKIAENIRKIFSSSEEYKKRILELAADKRKIVRQYLQQEIDFDESFAFVEFWGRGYTQDVFGRLLNDAANKNVINPFYYVRSFTNNTEHSLRHNFILTQQNFSFFEPIFANTPYESIVDYQVVDNRIEPVLVPNENDIHHIISDGLRQFVKDYLSLSTDDYDYLDYALANYSYNYQLTTPNDQFICNVLGEFKYNESSYGEDKSYAPELTIEILSSLSNRQELNKITRSVPISLAKSNEETRALYQKIYQKYKLPRMQVSPIQMVYAVSDLENYVYSTSFPFKVIAIKPNVFHSDVIFNSKTRRNDILLEQLEVIDVIAIDWLKSGVPRLLTSYGYITANKSHVQKLDSIRDFIQYDENTQTYIWKPVSSVQSLLDLFPKLNHLINGESASKEKSISKKPSNTVGNTDRQDFVAFQKKFYKFTRDPHGFFKDVKNPKIAKIQFFFNEKHKLGKSLSNFVRRNF